MWTLYEGDCFDYLPRIDDGSVDMVLCDLPYGTTACKWDTPLPLDQLWLEYERIIKPNGAIVLTGSQPFTSHLVMSNPKLFRYEWIWEKSKPGNIAMANKVPMKYHENILIFSKKAPIYNKQMIPRESRRVEQCQKNNNKVRNYGSDISSLGFIEKSYHDYDPNLKNPSTIIKINSIPWNSPEFINHPTQKPVALFEYLIKTYTNPGDTVLDNCAGSGTTGVACENTGRHSILMEKEEEYCQVIRERLQEHTQQTKLPVTVEA